MRRSGKRPVWLVVLLLLTSGAWAESRCPNGERLLEVPNFGTVYFAELASEGEGLRLFGGICIEIMGANGLIARIEAETLDANGGDVPTLSAERVRLFLPGWVVEAQTLYHLEQRVHLSTVVLRGEGVMGSAAAAVFDPTGGSMIFEALEAVAGPYRVAGATAELIDGRLHLHEALVTTCLCEGQEIYLIRAPDMDVDLLSETVAIRDGTLYLGAMPIPLASELLLSEETLAGFGSPIRLEPIDDDSGLALYAPNLVLAPGLGLQVGLVNLGGPEPLDGIFLIQVDQPGVQARVGKAWQGPQADVELTQPLAPWLDFTFGVHNRPWPQADFLHQGFLRLDAHETLALPARQQLNLHAAAFAAVSTQTLNSGAVTSPRLGAEYGLVYSAPLPLGEINLAHAGSLTHYPFMGSTQVGLRFEPAWQMQAGPLSLGLTYALQVTNGASPFSQQLDRLEPVSLISGEVHLAGETPGLSAALGLRASYDTLAPSAGAADWGEFSLLAQAGVQVAEWQLRPSLELDASGFIWPHAPEASASLAASLDFSRDHWQFGVRSRYGLLAHPALELLELNASIPLQLGSVRLQPFFAVDLAAALQGGALALSGHGLELEWRHCCGILSLGYRQHNEHFSTTLSVRLD